MSDTRRADPTLTDLVDLVYLEREETYGSWGDLPIAHRHRKHAGGWWQMIEAKHARWFAVPCRACFPQAPPPGHPGTDNECPAWRDCTHEHPGLAWQLGHDDKEGKR